jgi:hypothetical protein
LVWRWIINIATNVPWNNVYKPINTNMATAENLRLYMTNFTQAKSVCIITTEILKQ